MVTTPERRLKRLRRSLAVVVTLLAATPLILAGARAWLLPWAVGAGWADAWIREALREAGISATLESASMPAPDLLELRGLRLDGLPAAVTSLRIDRARVRFSEALPGGAPLSVSLEGADLDFDVELWRRTQAGGWNPLTLPELILSDGRLCVRTGDSVESVSDLSGRYDPSSREMALTGNLDGAGPGSFKATGRLDPPALSIETRRDSLPGALERLASRLLGVKLRSLSERRARTETLTIAADPEQLLERGFRSESFEVSLNTTPDGLRISGSLPPVEMAPADDPRRLRISGGFDLDRRADGSFSGVVRLLARLVESEEGPSLEEADLLLDDLEIDAEGRVKGSGILYLMDGRALQVEVESQSDEELAVKLASEAWDLAMPWRLPWALAGAEPATMDGLAALSLEAVVRPEEVRIVAELRGESIVPVPGWSFRRISPRVTVRRSGQVEGTVEVERAPSGVGRIGLSGAFDKQFRGSAVVVWTDAGETATLYLDEFSWGESFSGRGRIVLPGGLELRVVRLEPAALEVAATRIDLARLPARAWKELGLEGLSASGLVSGWLSLGPDGVSGTMEAEGRARVAQGSSSLSFRRLGVSPGAGRHRASVSGVELEAAGTTVTSSQANLQAWSEDGFTRVTIEMAGGQLLRGSRLVDAGSRNITADVSGRWDPSAERVEGHGTLTVDGWGTAYLEGAIKRAGDSFHHRMKWKVDAALEPALTIADWGLPPATGRWTGTFRTTDQGAGLSLEPESVGATIDRMDWGRWSLLNAQVVLSGGDGSLAVERLLYPGGATGRFKLGVSPWEGGWLLKGIAPVEGSYGAGKVVMNDVVLTVPAIGGARATAGLRAEGIDLKRFSEQVGIVPAIGGRLGGTFGRVTVTPERISFEEGGLRGEGIFDGAWEIKTFWIEDPFGPDTSYEAAMAFEDINLRHVSRHLIDSKVTRHGVIHGRARGESRFKMLHDGSLENFELWIATFQKPDVDQFVHRDGAQTLAKLFGRADLAAEMEQLPERPNYFGLAMYATMGLDRKVRLRGGYFKPRPGEKAEPHTLEEARGGVERGRRYFFIGSGLFKVDLDEEMVKEPIPWEVLRGRLAD